MDLYESHLNDRAARAAVRAGMLLPVLAAALSFAAGCCASAAAQTDGGAPPTVIKGFVGDPFRGPNEDKPKLHTIQQTSAAAGRAAARLRRAGQRGAREAATRTLDGDLLLSAAREKEA